MWHRVLPLLHAYVMCGPKRVHKRNRWYLLHVCVMITDGLIVYDVNIEFRGIFCYPVILNSYCWVICESIEHILVSLLLIYLDCHKMTLIFKTVKYFCCERVGSLFRVRSSYKSIRNNVLSDFKRNPTSNYASIHVKTYALTVHHP